MTQVLTRPVGIEIPDIPADLIEQEALTLLGIEVVDRQDYTHKCVPHGDLRWWVHRGETELLGAISSWGKRFHTPVSAFNGYGTLFEAATSFILRGEVALAKSDAEVMLRDRFASTPDYI